MNNIQFFASPDDFLADHAARGAFLGVSEGCEEFCVEVVSGYAQTVGDVSKRVQDCCSALQTIPLFGGRKVVWFKSVNFLADSIVGRSEETKRQVEEWIAFLKQQTFEDCILIVSASPIDRRTRAVKWLQENARFAFLENDPKGVQLDLLVDDSCSTIGLVFEPGARDILYQKLNRNPRLVLQAVETLYCYLGKPGIVDETLVRNVIADAQSDEFFEVVEAFYAGNPRNFLKILKKFFSATKEIRPVLTAFQNRNRLLIQLKILIEAGDLKSSSSGVYINANTLKALSVKYCTLFGDSTTKSSFCVFSQHPFYLSRIALAANNFSLKSLLDLQCALITIFRKSLEGVVHNPVELFFLGTL